VRRERPSIGIFLKKKGGSNFFAGSEKATLVAKGERGVPVKKNYCRSKSQQKRKSPGLKGEKKGGELSEIIPERRRRRGLRGKTRKQGAAEEGDEKFRQRKARPGGGPTLAHKKGRD